MQDQQDLTYISKTRENGDVLGLLFPSASWWVDAGVLCAMKNDGVQSFPVHRMCLRQNVLVGRLLLESGVHHVLARC